MSKLFSSSIVKGGVKLSTGQAINQIASFLKNVIVARIVSPADFGIAALFSVTLSLLEMISSMAVEKLIIQSTEGDLEDFQSSIQYLQIIRGSILGLVIFVTSGLVARVFGISEAAWAFRWLALVPVVRGFIHQDINRLQRKMDFGPAIITESGASLFSMLLAYPLAILYPNYAAMLWITIAQAVFGLLLSHKMSLRKYKYKYNRSYTKQIFNFGWPLLINGLLLFGILQGDRLIIGSSNSIFGRNIYNFDQLGVYSVAFALTFAPTMLIANISSSILLPMFTSANIDKNVFIGKYKLANQVIVIIGGLIAIALITSGEWIIEIVYGTKYITGNNLIGWLAAMQAMRIFRVAPTLAAISKADTQNAMYSNLFRSLAVIGALTCAYLGMDISWIAISGFIGEILATIYCLIRLKIRLNIDPFSCLYPIIIALVFMFVGALNVYLYNHRENIYLNIISTTIIGIVYISSFIVIFKELRKEILNVVSIV